MGAIVAPLVARAASIRRRRRCRLPIWEAPKRDGACRGAGLDWRARTLVEITAMKRPCIASRFVLLPLAAALLAAAAPAAAADRTWFGGNGDWALDTNWTPSGVPGSADRA